MYADKWCYLARPDPDLLDPEGEFGLPGAGIGFGFVCSLLAGNSPSDALVDGAIGAFGGPFGGWGGVAATAAASAARDYSGDCDVGIDAVGSTVADAHSAAAQNISDDITRRPPNRIGVAGPIAGCAATVIFGRAG